MYAQAFVAQDFLVCGRGSSRICDSAKWISSILPKDPDIPSWNYLIAPQPSNMAEHRRCLNRECRIIFEQAIRLCLNFAWSMNTLRLLGIHGFRFVQLSEKFTKGSN